MKLLTENQNDPEFLLEILLIKESWNLVDKKRIGSWLENPIDVFPRYKRGGFRTLPNIYDGAFLWK